MADELNVRLGANISEFERGLAKASKDFNKFSDKLKTQGAKFQDIGLKMSMSITAPLAIIGGLAIKTAADFETLNTALVTTFKGNEKAAKAAFAQIIEFASKTPFQVEQVADAFIKLKNYGLDPSERALTAYGDTAAAMGKSLNQMIEAVADASTGEMERLKEFGIKASKQGDQVSFTFRGVTKTVANESSAIQGYLMSLGETEFAGGMDAQSKTFSGKLSTLKDNVALMSNEFGKILIEMVNPFVEKIGKLAEKFKNLSPAVKEIIVKVALFAAAIGPVLIGLGFLMTTVIPGLVAGFALLTAPILAIGAGLIAIGVIIYKNWKPIKQTLVDIANYFIDLYNESTVFRIAVKAIILTFQNLWTTVKFVFKAIWSTIKAVGSSIMNQFKFIGAAIKAALTFDVSGMKKAMSDYSNNAGKTFDSLIGNLKSDFNDFSSDINQNVTDAINGVPKRVKIVLTDDNVDTSAMTGNDDDDNNGEGKDGTIKNSVQKMLKATLAEITPLTTAINAKLAATIPTISPLAAQFQSDLQIMKLKLEEFNNEAANLIEGAISSTFAELGRSIGEAMANGTNVFAAAGTAILTGIGNFLGDLGKMMIKYGVAAVAYSIASKALLNPLTALPSGIALIAAGTLLSIAGGAISGALKKGSGSGSSEGASSFSGSSAGSGSSSFSGGSASSSGGGGGGTFVFEIAGTKLVGVLKNTLDANRALGGSLGLIP